MNLCFEVEKEEMTNLCFNVEKDELLFFEKVPKSNLNSFVVSENVFIFGFAPGQVRLARNLLQMVLRNWYARESTVTTSFAELRALALEAARAALLKDGAALGSAIDRYWHLKKVVASGCEPSQVGCSVRLFWRTSSSRDWYGTYVACEGYR